MSATCETAVNGTSHAPTSSRPTRVMRWTFWRDDEMLVCELGLNRDDSAYELRIDPPTNPVGIATQIFHDVTPAFERHGAIERLLIDGGWSLEQFESGATDRLPNAVSPAAAP